MEVLYRSPHRPRGLTLLELITTLAVTAVSLTLLVPSWMGFTQRSQVTAAANQLLTHLRYARSEAVMRHRTVTLCPSDDGQGCSGDAFGWHRGYIVFNDLDGDQNRQKGEKLLRVEGPHPPAMRLQTSAGRPAVRFRPDGAAWGTNATFRVCVGEPDRNRAVVLYGSGRARVDRRATGNKPVVCG